MKTNLPEGFALKPILACCLFVIAGPLAAQDIATQQQRAIVIPSITQTELIAVPLDSAAYHYLADDFSDLRVVDERDRQLSYVMRKQTTAEHDTTQESWTVNNPILQPSEADGLTIRFTLQKDDPVPQWLNVRTPLNNFEQSVVLYGEVDGQEQEIAREVIFDYAQYMNVRRTQIPIPSTTSRTFRLVIGSLTAEQESLVIDLTRELQAGSETRRYERFSIARRPFRIDRLELAVDVRTARNGDTLKQPYAVEIQQVTEDHERQETILELTSHREPLTRLTLQTSTQNFGRAVRLETETSAGTRRTLVAGRLSSINIRSINEQQLDLAFPASRHARYFLIISNGDSPPLEITGVTAEGDRHDVCFLAEPGQQFRLLFGGPATKRPDYDDDALHAALRSEIPALTATLNAAEVVPVVVPVRPFEWRDVWNNPLITIPVIAVLIGVLGWGLYHAAARIEAIPQDENTSSGGEPSP